MSVAVLGGGAFGTALAIALGHVGTVTLWARDCRNMQTDRENAARLPGCSFPLGLTVTDSLDVAMQAETLLFAVPMQALSDFEARLDLADKGVVACCKGIDLKTGQGPSTILSSARDVAVLTGPSFAHDIARGLPTALTIACTCDAAGERLQQQLSTPVLRLYRTTDVIGAELGGALKNVIAIGCGAVMGAGLGPSARAALMTRGFAEMLQVARALGARPETLMGLSGFGDLALTCTSDGSRNYRHGVALGAGHPADASTTVEGVATARALRTLAGQHRLDLPVCDAVVDLVDGTVDVAGAMAQLLSRPLKTE
ncbi:MAG: NAD(P)H-dependent glycerol-3-phosphate dehydrogenase [Pseudomonadota bacterium]